MLCSICEAEEAAFTIIPTGEGLPESLGPICFARSGLEVAKASLPAEEIAALLGPLFVDPAREDLHQGAKQEQAKRSRKSKAPAAEAAGEAGGQTEAAAAPENG